MDADERELIPMTPQYTESPAPSDNDSGVASLGASDENIDMPETPALDETHSKAAQLRMVKGAKRKLNELDGDEGEADEDANEGERGNKRRIDLIEDNAGSDGERGKKADDNHDEKKERSLKEMENGLLDRLERRDRALTNKHSLPPTNIIRCATSRHVKGKSYRKSLEDLPKEKPTAEQIDKLRQSMRMVPNYLCRTSSLTAGKRFHHEDPSNGVTTKRVMMPAADLDSSFVMHHDLFDLNVGELTYLVAHHLIWADLNCDEFLSWSISPLFNIMHGLNRYNEGQGGTSLLYLDTRKAKTRQGEKATFIHALRLYEEFEVPLFHGWTKPMRSALTSRKFTQEYTSHGSIINDDDRFVQAKISTLIQTGLYDIFPELQIPPGQKRTGLYGGLVLFRTIGYPPNEAATARKEIYSYDDCAREVPFTEEYLEKVRKLTRCCMAKKQGDDQATREPHLHIFLSFLTFYKRKTRDPGLVEWIQRRYTSEDLVDIYDNGARGPIAGFTHVANNLPEVMQYLDLLRDAAWALGVPAIPATVVETQNALTGEVYMKADSKLQRHEVKSRVYVKKAKLEEKSEIQISLLGIAGDDEPDAGDGDKSENSGEEVGSGAEEQEEEVEETSPASINDWAGSS